MAFEAPGFGAWGLATKRRGVAYTRHFGSAVDVWSRFVVAMRLDFSLFRGSRQYQVLIVTLWFCKTDPVRSQTFCTHSQKLCRSSTPPLSFSSLSLFPSLSLSLRLPLPLYVSVSLFLSLSLSIRLASRLYVSLSLCVSFCLSLSRSLPLSVAPLSLQT